MNGNVEILRNIIIAAINTKYSDVPPTEDEFTIEATSFRKVMEAGYPISDADFNNMLKSLKADLVLIIGDGYFITGQDSAHAPWISARRADIEFYYWNRYKAYLKQKNGWNSSIISNLDRVTDEIMDLLGDPVNKSVRFQRRGLILGDVQSGKTANYTAICNKAADCGYKVIIVLAGMIENLRVQTQERLDAEFAGRQSKYFLDPNADQIIKNKPVGVGVIPPVNPDKRISCFTSVIYDFNRTILKSNDLTLKSFNGTAIFVVKKNKSVLNNLYKWLLMNNSDSADKINLPLLVIDDEADNASVNTQSEDKSPTAINAAIRNILNSFYQTSYIGITATPYANIFIDPNTPDGKPDDLFPRHFIYVLPAPSNYIGPDAIFGSGEEDDWHKRKNASYEHSIIKIYNNEMNQFFPFKHKKDLVGKISELPPSLYEAIGYFLLINAVRDIRGDYDSHRSMLINVSRYTDVQNTIANLIYEWIVQIRTDLENYAALEETKTLKIESIRYLKVVWDKHDISGYAGCDWKTFQQKHLYKAVAPMEVRAVNQMTGPASLDYFAHKGKTFRVIAVGGNSLSRGLTLEGLCVSYFYRNSMMYDTLLQMGRWFGYRKNYEDLFRIWMAEEAVDWYGYITDATNELKIEILRMRALKLTPEDFGLKVRQDPNSLIVTARNKMRTATRVSRPVTVSGRLLETPKLINDLNVLEKNKEKCIKFISDIDHVYKRGTNDAPRAILWREIPKEQIVNLIRNFQSHPWHLAFQSGALADYIEENQDLDKWDVAIPEGSVKEKYCISTLEDNIFIEPEERSILEKETEVLISGTKVKVGSGSSTRIGLTQTEIDRAKNDFEAMFADKSPSDSTYLIQGRKPILMIHIIRCKPVAEHELSLSFPSHIFALGVGFPHTGKETKTANYMVNIKELENWIDITDYEDDDDADV